MCSPLSAYHSLPALYSLSCCYSMASSHYLPLLPSLSLSSAPFLPRGLCLLTLTKLKGLSLGRAWATWKQQKQIPLTSLSPPSMAPCQWPAVALYVALPILVNSNHWQLLQALFYGPPSSHGFPAVPPGRLSLAVPCLMLFCKLLSPGSLLITVQGLCKATQRRPGEGEHAGTLGGLKELRRWSIQIPNEIITTN